jgi:hypothetical protein
MQLQPDEPSPTQMTLRSGWVHILEFESGPLRQRVPRLEGFAATVFVQRAHARFALLKGTGETYWSAEIANSAGLSLSAKMAVDFGDSPNALVSTIRRTAAVFGVP